MNLKICSNSFEEAWKHFSQRTYSHPCRQDFFLHCFFNKQKDVFKKEVLKYAVNEKDSRKQRIRYKNPDCFIQTVDPLTNEEIKQIDQGVELLFDQNPFDEYFVEKVYCILEGIVDHLKQNGSIAIGEYVKKNNPSFLQDKHFIGHTYVSHWVQCVEKEYFDNRLIDFNNEKNKTQVIDYCKQYRNTNYVKSWIQLNEKEIKQAFQGK